VGSGAEVTAPEPESPLQAVAVETITMAEVARKRRREMGCTRASLADRPRRGRRGPCRRGPVAWARLSDMSGDSTGAPQVVSLEGFNPFSESVQQCPHLYYRAMQEQAPVFRVEGTELYMVTKHELVTPILRDTVTFSSRFQTAGEMPKGEVVERIKAVLATGWPQVPTMLTIDPPQHTRYRSTVAQYFTPKRLAELKAPVADIVSTLIDRLPEGEVVDLVTSFAVPLPIEAIAQVLNVPADRMADFKRWSDDSIANIGSIITDERRVQAFEGIVEFQHYFAEQLERRRAEPTGDLMSELVQAQIDDEQAPDGRRELTMAEMLSIVQQLLVAGNETTTKSLTEGVKLLAEHPDVWAKLQADPSGYAPMVAEEVLRLSSPTQGMFRVVTADTELAGVPIPKGARLLVMFAAANRDPAVWGDDPDRFDPDRPNHKDHLAFGKGIHFCLGAPLSRIELQAAFEGLARRLDRIELAEGNDFRYHPSFMLRGLVRLDVRVAHRAAVDHG
jgi:cytochrome P450